MTISNNAGFLNKLMPLQLGKEVKFCFVDPIFFQKN